MQNLKPIFRFGHDKKIIEFREFSAFDKEWKLMPVATKDNASGKAHHYATAAVHNKYWWWTLHNN